jgi:hypothetical protein
LQTEALVSARYTLVGVRQFCVHGVYVGIVGAPLMKAPSARPYRRHLRGGFPARIIVSGFGQNNGVE